ncbi:hypothetical protein [Bacillus sp. 1P06AnD]|uniref:hypothetical protein n=1 Tax=Bacillus sp. 1P06AnD TaxID=3132208 RepID=UPI0039A373F6
MRELIGYCCVCKKELFCLDGFFNGIIEEGQLFCFDCDDQAANQNDPQCEKE